MKKRGRRAFARSVLPMVLLLAACQGRQVADNARISPILTPVVDGSPTEMTGDPLAEFNEAIGNTVYFETNSSVLTASAEAVLQRQAQWLARNPTKTLTIEGHADERGTREFNLGLGERRANAVAGYLAALGVNPGRLSILSFGKERPLCSEAAEACWALNRRGVSALNP